jgi:hypothetical protein
MKRLLDWVLAKPPNELVRAFNNYFQPGPIATVEAMAYFVQTRSAFVAQTALFGYLKERMGTSYPRYFEDEVFSVSIRQAQMRVYTACSADLAVFAAAMTATGAGLADEKTKRLARICFDRALRNRGRELEVEPSAEIERFHERTNRTVWRQAAIGENAFIESPPELIAAAPVMDEYKSLDEEIVVNSIRFRWRDIREQLRKRLDAAAIREDFQTTD